MATPNSLPVPNTPFLDMKTGLVTREWTRFLYSLNRNSSDAVAGEVATPSGSGLEGGGFVADGVDLSIATNGVTNAMIRQSIGCSVVGRYADSTGNVGDILANQNRVVLQRQGDLLAFYPSVDVATVTCDTLITGSDPPATAASAGTAGTITWDSGFIYICVATDTWVRAAIATW